MANSIASIGGTMLRLQDSVNSKINADWRLANNAWYRAIWTESAELIEHVGWKWWKKQEPNFAQAQLELIDIWHFGLSDVLEKTKNQADALESLRAALEMLAEVKPISDEQMKNEDLLILVEEFAAQTLLTKEFNSLLFAKLAKRCGLTLQDIFTKYVGKNVLNIFRQNNGYKNGQYKKIWFGREDNEWLVDLSEQLDSLSSQYEVDLYKALENQYSKVI